MIAAVYIITIIVYFVVNVCAYSRFKEIAAMKGHENFKFAVWMILFGIVGMLMVVALPDRGGAVQRTPSSDELPEL